jgi:uncharacterized membrane protein
MRFRNQFTLAILLFLMGLLSIGLKTQKAIAATRTINVCNSSSENVSFALAWSNAESMGGGGFGWLNNFFVEGWYNLNAGQCDNYSVDIGSTAVGPSSVWIYGISKNHEYPRQSVFVTQERSNLFCIRPSLRFLYTNRQGRGSAANPQAQYNPSSQRWYCEGESQADVRRFTKLESNNFSFIPNSSNLTSSTPTPRPTPTPPHPQQSNTSINFCNRTSEPIYAAYAAYDQNNGWQSNGWYKVEPQQCRDVSLGRVYTGNTYVYGMQGSTYWGSGDASLCIDQKNAFTIRHSDTDTCSGGNFKKVPMTRLSVNPGQNNWNLTLNTTPTSTPTPTPTSEEKPCLVQIGGHCILR